MPPKWQRLHLSQKGLPPLLFQYTWSRQGYEIHITDLTYIWSERLPRKTITKRAEEDATTILERTQNSSMYSWRKLEKLYKRAMKAQS
jgi:hypothetical protein